MARSRPIRSAKSYSRLRGNQRYTYSRVLDALGNMRRGESLSAAARRAGTTPSTVRKYAGATVKRSDARYKLGRDRMYRPMKILTNTGVETVGVSPSEASTVGRYWNAVERYLTHGDHSDLDRFSGIIVGGYELETDLDVIDELAARGELDFENIYELAA